MWVKQCHLQHPPNKSPFSQVVCVPFPNGCFILFLPTLHQIYTHTVLYSDIYIYQKKANAVRMFHINTQNDQLSVAPSVSRFHTARHIHQYTCRRGSISYRSIYGQFFPTCQTPMKRPRKRRTGQVIQYIQVKIPWKKVC